MKATFFAAFAIVFTAAVSGAPASRPISGDDTALQIKRLTDPDPRTRDLATLTLIQRGEKMRQQVRTPLLAAARSGNPELRSRAAKILLRLPWHEADDPPQAKQFLVGYGQLDDTQRVLSILRHRSLGLTRPILLRLLREDPSDAVRWAIVERIVESPDISDGSDLRKLDVSLDDPPVLTLAGVGWLARDRQRGLELLQRAIDADALHPQNDRGGMDVAFDRLAIAAVEDSRLHDAELILRAQASRGPAPASESIAAAKLLALRLHLAYPGPDERTTPAEILRRVYAQVGMVLPAPCRDAISRAANLSRQQHYFAGTFLAAVDEPDAAEIELRACVSQSGSLDVLDANALIHLGRLAGERNDDHAAVEYLTRLTQVAQQLNLDFHGREADIWTEVHYRKLRLAHAKDDAAAVKLHVAELDKLAPSNANSAIEAVNTLKQFGHNAQAAGLFQRTYDRGKAGMLAEPENAILKNDLAWLCARSGERLPEALELATAALAAAPDNPAFMDTAAEAHFRVGHHDEAVRLETRALELRPKDKFMREQLERFKAGKK